MKTRHLIPIPTLLFIFFFASNVYAEVTSFEFVNTGAIDSDGTGTRVLAEFEPASETQGDLNYTFTTSSAADFAGIFHSFDRPETGPVETGNLSQLNSIVVGISASVATDIRLEVKDHEGDTGFVLIQNSGGNVEQLYTIPRNFYPPNVNFDRVREINLVLVASQNPSQSDIMSVHFGYYNFIPEVPGAVYNPNALTDMQAGTVTVTRGTPTSQITLAQDNPNSFQISYSLPNQTDFAFAQVSWGGFFDGEGNYQGGAETIKNLGNPIVIAAAGPQNSRLKVEIKDINNRLADYFLILTTQPQNYIIFLSGDNLPHQGFDATQIVQVNMVVSQNEMGSSGTVTLEAQNFQHVPQILPDPNLTLSDITPINNFAAGGFSGGSAARVRFRALSSITAEINYRILQLCMATPSGTPPAPSTCFDSFGGIFHVYDNPDTEQVESINYNLLGGDGTLVIGAQSPAGTLITLELKDALGNQDVVHLMGQNGNQLFYAISAAAFENVDVTQIIEINLVLNSGVPGQRPTGTLLLSFGIYA